MSHSIHRLSIQIDTKSIELVQQHQIVLNLQAIWKEVSHYSMIWQMLYDYEIV